MLQSDSLSAPIQASFPALRVPVLHQHHRSKFEMAKFWPPWRASDSAIPTEHEKEIAALRERAPVPSIWLFGKTGSGKSSIIRYLTGAEAATIGEGYRPETKTSRRFDFPDSVDPLLTFIDTRGLGEAEYDPQPDIDRFVDSSQLIIVAVRVTDHALEEIIEPVRRIRSASPSRPILLVLTCLHEATGLIDITTGDDPFAAAQVDKLATAASDTTPNAAADAEPSKVPLRLKTLIEEKQKQFAGLYDAVIPIDLTRDIDGFADPNFGGARLKNAILEYLPHAYRQVLLTLNRTDKTESVRQTRARWQVLASSALAATAGAVPVPWVDIPVVLGLQAHLALRIAKIYEQEITPADWAMLSSAAGSRIALRMSVVEALKLIPFWGIAASAASSFAFTYALGMSWDWYFANKRGGNVPSANKLKEIFEEQLQRGRDLWIAK